MNVIGAEKKLTTLLSTKILKKAWLGKRGMCARHVGKKKAMLSTKSLLNMTTTNSHMALNQSATWMQMGIALLPVVNIVIGTAQKAVANQ